MPLAPRASRAVRRDREMPRPGAVVPRILMGIAVLYAVVLLAFWALHYEGHRPSAGRVIQDFHAFLGMGPSEAKAALPPVPEPEPEPVRVKPPKPAPPPPPPPPEPSKLDEVADTIRRVEKAAKGVKALSRGGELEAARIELVSELTDARDTLNEILDNDPDHYRANGLWDKLQRVLVALRKL